MTNAPQSVTERYVSNLIHNGRNKEFDIYRVEMEHAYATGIDNEPIGVYFKVELHTPHGRRAVLSDEIKNGAGATLAQAVRRALEKHGVTFR